MSVRPDLVACWLFRPGPDGRLEPGERIVEAALREVEEETGLGPDDLEAIFETDFVNWFHEVAVDALLCEAVFAARVRPTAAVRLSSEHDDSRWVDPETAGSMVVWPAYRRAIEQVAWLAANAGKATIYELPRPV